MNAVYLTRASTPCRLADLKYGTAQGIVTSIKDSFTSINITEESFEKKLIGFGADGASTNSGEKGGVIAILKIVNLG